MAKTIEVHEVIVEDLTHLGGPMGSEYTTTIGTELFTSEAAALDWAHKDAQRRRPDRKHMKNWQALHDCLSVGYLYRKRVVK